ncbi:hypothetical protein GOP47_0005396 [Adiantum capillus-veneris]|uniref:Transmembrane protein n=1 Tax=Adiantum capillus-veneris TaxID=13818 RepID=A0A9D4V6N7_ADICA|nr:hypothetical protein GOP47_0005396 [Adiantum capillus-veneris]
MLLQLHHEGDGCELMFYVNVKVVLLIFHQLVKVMSSFTFGVNSKSKAMQHWDRAPHPAALFKSCMVGNFGHVLCSVCAGLSGGVVLAMSRYCSMKRRRSSHVLTVSLYIIINSGSEIVDRRDCFVHFLPVIVRSTFGSSDSKIFLAPTSHPNCCFRARTCHMPRMSSKRRLCCIFC